MNRNGPGLIRRNNTTRKFIRDFSRLLCWKGADSALFLRHAGELATAQGYAISNIDLTLICERPKIGPHAAAMAQKIAQILGIAPGRVSIKATTSERLGFTGREEGIAAMATTLLTGGAS